MKLAELLQRAMQMHGAGNLAQAERLYNEVLVVDRRQFDALQMLGIVQCQRGSFGAAIALFKRALEGGHARSTPSSISAAPNPRRAI